MATFETPTVFYENLSQLKKELLKGGGNVRLLKEPKRAWRLRHETNLEVMESVIDAHNVARESGSNDILKDGKKRCVTKVDLGGKRYVVKEFFTPGPWGHFSSDARGWLNNWYMECAGLPVPKALAWSRRQSGPGYIVYEYLPGESGYHVIRECVENDQRFAAIAAQIVDLLNHLYRWRMVHEDLKLSNLLITSDRLYLVDNDALIIGKQITKKSWLRNVRHLTQERSCVAEEKLYQFLVSNSDIIATKLR